MRQDWPYYLTTHVLQLLTLLPPPLMLSLQQLTLTASTLVRHANALPLSSPGCVVLWTVLSLSTYAGLNCMLTRLLSAVLTIEPEHISVFADSF